MVRYFLYIQALCFRKARQLERENKSIDCALINKNWDVRINEDSFLSS